ncbi:Fic family protein [Ochrobactrum sp. MT180101]|nr:Fic family protein [Ochrobactrum sp. MT180101]
MKNPRLEQLLPQARRHRMTMQERHEQGISYILGNVGVDVPNLFRGTVTMAVPREALGANPIAGSIVIGESEERIPFDVNGAVRQFRLVQQLAEQYASAPEQLQIDTTLIRQLHAAAGDPTNPAFGNFRDIEVIVGAHRAPPPTEVAPLVDAFCADLKLRWETEDALRLSAYALWRVNWIHPFVDANGRTARALSYLILNLKFGMLLPGVPTLLEQLGDRRRQYFDALAMADATYASTGTADINPLEKLLEELLLRQLRNMPAQSDHDEAALFDIFERRIAPADPALLTRLYGSDVVSYRAWASGDTLIVHVGPALAIKQAEALFERCGRPFPGLIARPGESARLTLGAAQRGAIVRLRDFVIDKAAVHLEPNAAVVIEAPQIVFASADEIEGWEVTGALYALRSGDEINTLWTLDVLDWLISRHLQEN